MVSAAMGGLECRGARRTGTKPSRQNSGGLPGQFVDAEGMSTC